jgi:hypothetical protein
MSFASDLTCSKVRVPSILRTQVYLSSDLVCYESKGVPVDIKLLNKKTDIENGIDPLIISLGQRVRIVSSRMQGSTLRTVGTTPQFCHCLYDKHYA